MSFSQWEASLRDNLSARGEEVKKKKRVMQGTEYTTKHKKKGRNHHTQEPRCLPSEADAGYLL